MSRLQFDTGDDFELRQHALLAAFGWRVLEQTTLQFAAGGILDGRLTREVDYTLNPGPLLSAMASHQWLDSTRWFLVTTASLGASFSRAELESGEGGRFSALDARLSVAFGASFAETLNPFLLARGFGGPVVWRVPGETRTGSDRDHYSLGAGAIVKWGDARFSLAGAALGERSLSVGFSWHF